MRIDNDTGVWVLIPPPSWLWLGIEAQPLLMTFANAPDVILGARALLLQKPAPGAAHIGGLPL